MYSMEIDDRRAVRNIQIGMLWKATILIEKIKYTVFVNTSNHILNNDIKTLYYNVKFKKKNR